ncbi:MAG: sterol desaturase family protein [Leptospirales bacterium]|jgi:sterol desaturase/sphingolipid hydroxylase (fatty acid hydroxylase superfamily)
MDLAKLNPIELAVPFFVLLIFVELLVSRFNRAQRERRLYRMNDSITALSTALIFSITGVAIAAGSIWWYARLEATWSVPALLGGTGLSLESATWWQWLLVLVAVDFLYYWFHRACHEVRFLWACHVTHHSGEEFNLTTALRQCSFQRVFEYMFMAPLAFAGVPWQMMFICHGGLKIFQFWVHTRAIGKLGVFESFLLTPSHHRVHHGRDPRYLDKNHGGILVIWDRIFGSYAEETHEPNYGLVKPLRSFDPLHANLHEYVGIFRDMRSTRGWWNRVQILFRSPGWRPADSGGPRVAAEVPAEYRKYDPALSPRLSLYVRVQFLALLAGSLVFLKIAKSAAGMPNWPLWLLVAAGAYLVAGLASVGMILAARENPFWSAVEAARLIFAALAVVVLGYGAFLGQAAAVGVAIFALVSFVWLRFFVRASFDVQVPVMNRVS